MNPLPPALLILLLALVHAAQTAELPNCSATMDPALRQRCEQEFSRRVTASSETAPLAGGWRLVKTADPHGGPKTVSIMHISDTSKSDFGLAGLTLRCGPTGIETLLVLLDPPPQGSHPLVTVKDGQHEMQFVATLVEGGQMLLLPQEASNSANTIWQSATELALAIASNPSPIRGVVPIEGLPGALRSLTQACSAR
jgi:hypothetical protein